MKFHYTEGEAMKTLLAIVCFFVANEVQAFSGDYQCKVDSRGVIVCYPKPRGF
jgi:hypothetical protein